MSYKSDFRERISQLKNRKNQLLVKKSKDAFLCSLCNIKFNEKKLYDEHQNDVNHKEKLSLFKKPSIEKLKEFKSKKRNAELNNDDIVKIVQITDNSITAQPKLYVETVEPVLSSSFNDQSSGIPEGFFDNPQEDAKARNVAYVDKFESAYEQFQSELVDDLKASDKLYDQLFEQAEIDKDAEEINHMQDCIDRMYDLRNQVDHTKKLSTSCDINDQTNTSSSPSVSDCEDLSSWRFKNPFNK